MPDAERPLTSLLTDLVRDVTTLLRNEVALAKAEASETAQRVVTAVVELAVGGLLAFAGLLVLLGALVQLLARYMDPALAALVVGGTVALIGILLLLKGKSSLAPEKLALPMTTQNLKRDAELVKEQIRG